MMDETLQLEQFAQDFEEALEALREGRVPEALDRLLQVRERGLVDRHLDQCINLLRDRSEGGEFGPVVNWLERMLAGIRRDEESIFENIEEVTSTSDALNESDLMPLSEASSVGMELRELEEGEEPFPGGSFDEDEEPVTAQFEGPGDAASEESGVGGDGEDEEPTQILDSPGDGFALVDSEASDDSGVAGAQGDAQEVQSVGGRDSDAETAIPESEPDEDWAQSVMKDEGQGPPSAPEEASSSRDLLGDLDAALEAADREHEEVREDSDEGTADTGDEEFEVYSGESEALELGESDVVYEGDPVDQSDASADEDSDLGFDLGLENPGASDPAGLELGGGGSPEREEKEEKASGEEAEAGDSDSDIDDFFSEDYDSADALFDDDFDFGSSFGDDSGDPDRDSDDADQQRSGEVGASATPVFSENDATPMIAFEQTGGGSSPSTPAEFAESSAPMVQPEQPSIDELFEGGFESDLPLEDGTGEASADSSGSEATTAEPPEQTGDEGAADLFGEEPEEPQAAADLFAQEGGDASEDFGANLFDEEEDGEGPEGGAQPAEDFFGKDDFEEDEAAEDGAHSVEDLLGADEDTGSATDDSEDLAFDFGGTNESTRVADSHELADQLVVGGGGDGKGEPERDETDDEAEKDDGLDRGFQNEESTQVADAQDLASRMVAADGQKAAEEASAERAQDEQEEDGPSDEFEGLGLGFEESSEPTRVASSDELAAGLRESSSEGHHDEPESDSDPETGAPNSNPFSDDGRTAAVDPLDDNEFFKLVDSIAEDDSSGGQDETNVYRGEPLVESSVDSLSEVSSVPVEASQHPDGNSESSTFAPLDEVDDSEPAAPEEAPSDLSSPTESSQELNSGAVRLLSEAERLFEEGHVDSSHDLVQSVLDSNPDSERANELLAKINRKREPELLNSLGGARAVPEREIPMAKLAGGDFDHRFGFIMSLVDGQMCVDDILELSSMSRTETLSVLSNMLDREVISIR